jgi:hypothetical protein
MNADKRRCALALEKSSVSQADALSTNQWSGAPRLHRLNIQSERSFGTGSGVNAALRFGGSKRELLRGILSLEGEGRVMMKASNGSRAAAPVSALPLGTAIEIRNEPRESCFGFTLSSLRREERVRERRAVLTEFAPLLDPLPTRASRGEEEDKGVVLLASTAMLPLGEGALISGLKTAMSLLSLNAFLAVSICVHLWFQWLVLA